MSVYATKSSPKWLPEENVTLSTDVPSYEVTRYPNAEPTHSLRNRRRIGGLGFTDTGERIDGNNLLINQGDGTFEDAAKEYGVRRGGWGWAAVLEEFNNDGHIDLFHSATTNA